MVERLPFITLYHRVHGTDILMKFDFKVLKEDRVSIKCFRYFWEIQSQRVDRFTIIHKVLPTPGPPPKDTRSNQLSRQQEESSTVTCHRTFSRSSGCRLQIGTKSSVRILINWENNTL